MQHRIILRCGHGFHLLLFTVPIIAGCGADCNAQKVIYLCIFSCGGGQAKATPHTLQNVQDAAFLLARIRPDGGTAWKI
jgi:hypothetical protein